MDRTLLARHSHSNVLHSIVFICFSSNNYSIFLVSEAFLTGQPFAYPGVAFLGKNAFNKTTTRLQYQFDDILPGFKSASSKWERLEISDCSRTYHQDPGGLQHHRNLLVVVETGPDTGAEGWRGDQVWNHTRPPAYTDESINKYDPELINSLWSFAADCVADHVDDPKNWQYTQCTGLHLNDRQHQQYSEDTVTDMSIDFFYDFRSVVGAKFRYVSVKYCLSEPYSAPCKIYASNFFLLVIMLCTLLGCTCSLLVARLCWYEETCQSLGDALQAFLKHGETFVQTRYTTPLGSEGAASSSSRWTPVSKWRNATFRWGQVINKKRWLWTYVPIGIFLLGGSAALGSVGDIVAHVPDSQSSKSTRTKTYKSLDTMKRLVRALETE